MNPYTFVPLAGLPLRERAAGHARFSGHSGTLRCRLTARTPLFLFDPRCAHPADPPATPGHVVADFPTDDQSRPFIRGTALRGTIRSVAEAASRSCLALFDGHYERWTVDYRSRLPGAYRHCEPGDQLCPACRLFGTVGGTLAGFAGAVSISDATADADAAPLGERITVSAIQSPKPHHAAFYLNESGEPAGRKFYYHHPNGPTATIERSRFTRTVQPLTAGSSLAFTLSYRNLSDDDLQLLLYALLLEPEMGHKLGMGKPIGLGSVVLELYTAQNTSERDAALGRPATELSGETLQSWTDGLIAPLRASADQHLVALRAVLALDPGRPVTYPTADWFRSHPTAALNDVPDLVAPPSAPRRLPERAAATTPFDRPSRPQPPAGRPFERRGPPPSRGEGRRPPESRREPDEEGPLRPPPAQQPAPAPVEEPVVPDRPATLEDLVRRFSQGSERPARTDPTTTKESVRAREEQRRLMERLRQRRE